MLFKWEPHRVMARRISAIVLPSTATSFSWSRALGTDWLVNQTSTWSACFMTISGSGYWTWGNHPPSGGFDGLRSPWQSALAFQLLRSYELFDMQLQRRTRSQSPLHQTSLATLSWPWGFLWQEGRQFFYPLSHQQRTKQKPARKDKLLRPTYLITKYHHEKKLSLKEPINCWLAFWLRDNRNY